jgi:hypothetical protein
MNTEQFDGHTPGPWCTRALDPVAQTEWAAVTSTGDWILRVAEDNKGWPLSQADARLIAAAPDLLAEVKRLREAFLIATGHVGYGNHLGHNELRHALNSAGIDADALSWADEEWSEEE